MKPEEIARLRKDYALNSLNEDDVADSPVTQFENW